MYNLKLLSWAAPLDNPDLQWLREKGCNVTVQPGYPGMSEDELIELVGPECDGVMTGVEPFTRYVIERLPRLKTIARTGVGFNSIDLQAAEDHNVIVSITPGANRHAVADHTFGLMIMLAHHIPANQRMVAQSKWTRVVGNDVYGKTLGIIGVGNIGKEVARRAFGFDMTVLGYDIVQDNDFAQQYRVRYTSLEELMAQSDYITIHVPYYQATHYLVGAQELALAKPTAYIINTARGGIIDEAALYTALTEKWLAGAALDVAENEPNFASPLMQLENVLWTPHVAGITWESRLACLKWACRNAWNALSSEGHVDQVRPGAIG